ncbi:MAG: heme ABC exporter ATP-binding protein CcmA [Aeromicrobium sp.]|nr:heme ABC exporter ATP-binding protein CcmA [Burkholderiales bacterium]
MSEVALEAKELSLTRGPKQLFSGLSISVDSGHAVVLRGPNGVGKTSLLRVIAGLTEADAGEVLIGQQAVPALSGDARFSILYIGHANALKDDFTARENLADQLALDANFATQAQQLDALKAVGLYERRDVMARRLSQGQKRRIGLARLHLSCGAAQKSIWLLDEPTNALDADGSALFLRIVDAHLAAGGVAVIATHLLMSLSGNVVELHMQEL